MPIALSLVVVASLVAAFFDVRTRRIPNVLSIVLLGAAFALHAWGGWRAEVGTLAILTAGLFAGTVAFSFRLIGGGDVKLLTAACALMGYPDCMAFLLLTFISGGVLALAFAALRGRLRATITNVGAMAIPLLSGTAPERPDASSAMPYALAIFSGAALLSAFHLFSPHARILP